MPNNKRTFTLEDIKEAYEDGFYEGMDDLWYRDHDTRLENGDLCGLNPDAAVHKPMNEFIEMLLTRKNKELKRV